MDPKYRKRLLAGFSIRPFDILVSANAISRIATFYGMKDSVYVNFVEFGKGVRDFFLRYSLFSSFV
jgi:hypothetical protein